ncbi:MAG TPA: carboxypeptidase-like regulatory domain-containing protein, partial [Chitinophagaceae bacterium]|nr:carboxypeptidase-like regulatory domain-containing protein [Chitinophagaceae bacterium]
MRRFCLYFLIGITIWLPLKSAAQNNVLISGDYSGISFKTFAAKIEATYPYRFYYDSTETDSLIINVKAEQLTIQQLLEKAFSKTIYHFAVDANNRIFITKRFAIQTSLPDDFFAVKKTADTSTVKNIIPVFEAQEEVKEKLSVSLENKLYQVGSNTGNSNQSTATIAGYVRDIKTGEPIIGASVYLDTPAVGVNTDQFGYYRLTLQKGYHVIKVTSSGMKDTKRQVMLYSDGKLDIELQEYIASLKNVTVKAERTSQVKNLQMGVTALNIKTIKQVPVIFGEADITKVVLTLPGVISVGEASNGFNVRGGSTDQNLILFSDATVYNSSHLFGFFSAFNPDIIKGIELYKSTIPEKYGGRLSSVLDVDVRDGNTKKWSGAAGIGPLTSKFYIEGPLKKEKTSIVASVRTTYSDWILGAIKNTAYNNSSANFYDGTFRLSHIINAKNTIYLTGYISNDRFRLNEDTLYNYSNKNANLKWKHNFTNKFYNVITVGADNYDYSVKATKNEINAFKQGFDISQFNFRSDFSYSVNNKHSLSFGINSIYYKLHPGSLEPEGDKSIVAKNLVPAEQALESAIYFGDQYTVTPEVSVNAGFRYTVFNYLGPHDVNYYAPGIPKDTTSLTGTKTFSKGSIIQTYSAPEVRVAMRYTVADDASVKLSFNTTQQFIHMLSNTTAISPTDIWKLSDPNIKSQKGNQVSLGFYKDFKQGNIETSVEVYYKQTKNFLDYRSGANLVLNKHIETDIISTKGKSYGVELLLKKKTGRLNGWISYTYSRSFLKADDLLAGEIVNRGEYYPSNFDKPHSANFIANYQFSHRYNISANVVYSTGRPITLPLATFTTGGTTGLLYSDRNAYRIPDYIRADLSINIDGNHKVKQKTHNSWSFGVYNLLGRQNAYSVYFLQQDGAIKGYQLSIFGTIIPYVTYNIR